MSDTLSDSFYGWTFSGRDTSDSAVLENPRDEMLVFSRLGTYGMGAVMERISVPRWKFMDAVQRLKEEVERGNNALTAQYGAFNTLKRQVDYCLCDVI